MVFDGGGRTVFFVLNILVVDENDNYFVINLIIYSVLLYENLIVGDVVVKIFVRDNDSGIFL